MSSRARFCYNNWLTTDGFTVSSAQANYPANNLVSQIRSKVWKPDSNFEITASNNMVYVDGSSFAVPAGEYTFSELVTAFATASGALSLTLARNGSGLITITKGGSVTYNLSTTTDAIWSTLGMISTTDVTGTVVTADERAYHTSEWIKIDMGMPQQCDFAALIPSNGEAFTISSVAEVKLQANNVDIWTDPDYEDDFEIDNLGAFIVPDSVGPYRYWRIKIIDPTNSAISAAVAYIGDSYSPVSTNISTGLQRSSQDNSVTVYSESGALFADTRPKVLKITSLQIQFLKDDDLDDLEQLFYELGLSSGFFLCIDPLAQVSSSISRMTNYVRLDGPANFQHIIRGYYHTSFELKEVV